MRNSTLKEAAEAKYVEAKADLLSAVAEGLRIANKAWSDTPAAVGHYRVAVQSLNEMFVRLSELEGPEEDDE